MFDLKAIYAAVNVRRQELGLSWEDTAAKIGVDEVVLKSLHEDGDPPTSVVFAAVAWCGVDIEGFIDDPDFGGDRDPESAEKVASFLRADRDLKPDDAEAIEEVLRAAHSRFTND